MTIFQETPDDKVFYGRFKDDLDEEDPEDYFYVEVRYNPVHNFFMWYSEPLANDGLLSVIPAYICSEMAKDLQIESGKNRELLVTRYMGLKKGLEEIVKSGLTPKAEIGPLSTEFVPEQETDEWLKYFFNGIKKDYGGNNNANEEE